LKWEVLKQETALVGSKPTQGTEINNSELAEALQKKVRASIEELDKLEFTKEEWDKFGVRDLSYDAFVKVVVRNDCPPRYFKPAAADGFLDKELVRSFLEDTSGVSGVPPPSEYELLWVAQEALSQNRGGETDGALRPTLGLKVEHLQNAALTWRSYVKSKAEIEKIFKEFDKDNTDSLCYDQLTNYIKGLEEVTAFELSEEDVNAMAIKVMQEADDLNNGQITKPEMMKTLQIIRRDLAKQRLDRALQNYTLLDGGALKKEDVKSLLQELCLKEPTDKELLWVIQEATTEVLQFDDNKEKKGADLESVLDRWVKELKRDDLPRALVSWEHYIRESNTIEEIFKEFDVDQVHKFVVFS